MKYTPEKITELKDNQIFVFGSNLLGRHGLGAARVAMEKFGAIYGRGEGIQGSSYAFPTKDAALNTIPVKDMTHSVDCFFDFAARNPQLEFLLTKVGCGLAGYEPRDIAHIFKNAPTNVILPKEFHERS